MKYHNMRFLAADQGEVGAPVSDQNSSDAVPSGEDNIASSGADANNDSLSQSSGQEGSETQPKDLLAAVKAVVNTDGEASQASKQEGTQAPPNQQQQKVEQPNKGPLDDRAQAEADKQLPFHNHPRWKEINSERAHYKSEADSLRGDAEEQRAIQKYMVDNDIPAAEVANALQILAALRNDPLKGRDMIADLWEKLSEFSGDKLPADLQKKVEEGLLDEDAAKEVARLRHTQAFNINRGKEREQKTLQQQEQEQVQSTIRAVYSTTVDWEKKKRTSDPDFAEKESLINDKVCAIMHAYGNPKTPQQALQVLDTAYEYVTEHFKKFAPARRASASRPSSGGSISAAVQQPLNMLDVVRHAAEIT